MKASGTAELNNMCALPYWVNWGQGSKAGCLLRREGYCLPVQWAIFDAVKDFFIAQILGQKTGEGEVYWLLL